MQETPLTPSSSKGLCRGGCFVVSVCDGLFLVAFWFCKHFDSQLRGTYLPHTHLPRPTYVKT
jgi:hypothetical protein